LQHVNNSKKTKQLLGFKKTKEKNPPKQESLVFLERTVHRVGETAENQRKTREKTKVAENQVFWLDFCAKKKDCAYPLGGSGFNKSDPQHWHVRCRSRYLKGTDCLLHSIEKLHSSISDHTGKHFQYNRNMAQGKIS
jgi:hypothetical protein